MERSSRARATAKSRMKEPKKKEPGKEMVKIRRLTIGVLAFLTVVTAVRAYRSGAVGGSVIICDGIPTEVSTAAEPPGGPDLWVTTADLTRATRFEVKPQGVCRDEMCFPIPKDRKDKLTVNRGDGVWFNLSEFARMTHQPVAYDNNHRVWYFGARQAARNGFVQTLEAPDFRLPDLSGKMHSLSDFRGKKVLLITWASW